MLVLKPLHLLAAAAVLLALRCVPVHAAPEQLMSAAHGGHLWFVMDAPKSSGYVLCHHSSSMGGAYFKPQIGLPRMPLEMTSWENRVWLVFDAAPGSSRREVFTVEAVRDPTLGSYVTVPSGRMDMLPPLPSEGMLVGFSATRSGPTALLIPRPPGSGVLTMVNSGTPLIDALSSPQLLHLQNERWVETPLPPQMKMGRNVWLAALGDDGLELALLVSGAARSDFSRSVHYQRSAEGEWSAAEIPLDLRRVRSLTTLSGQLAAILAAGNDQFEVVCIRPASIVTLASFAKPSGRWSAGALNDTIHVLERRRNNEVAIQRIDPHASQHDAPVIMQVQPLSAGRIWSIALVTALLASGVLLLLLVRPAPDAAILLPKGTAPLPLNARLFSLAVDVLPSAVLATLMLRSEPADLLNFPLTSVNLQTSLPYLLAAGLTVLHCTITEAMAGRSLGKAVVGAQVARLDGSAANVGQVFVRNLVKGIMLLVPPLAAFMMLSPYLQGLADQAAGTLVIHHVPGASDQRAESRE